MPERKRTYGWIEPVFHRRFSGVIHIGIGGSMNGTRAIASMIISMQDPMLGFILDGI